MQLFSKAFQVIQNKTTSYIKLSINSIQLTNQNSLIQSYQQTNNLQIILHVDYLYFQETNQIKQTRYKLSQIIMKQVKHNKKEQYLLFQQIDDRWDCVNINQSITNNKNNNSKDKNKIHHQLRLKYEIINKQSKHINNNILKFTLDNLVQNKQKQQKKLQITKQQLQKKQQQQQNKLTNQVIYQSKQITISLDKIINNTPYLINQLNIDFKMINNQQKNNTISKQQTKNAFLNFLSINSDSNNNNNNNNNQKSQQLLKKQQQNSHLKPPASSLQTQQQQQRDGIINLSIIYLPQIKPQIQFKNIILKTKHFNTNYQLIIKEFNNSQQYNQAKQTQKLVSTIQIPLQPTNWQLFQNQQSHHKPIIIPLQLNNNLDQIQFSLQYEKKSSNYQQQQQQKISNQNLSKKKCIKLKSITLDNLYKLKNKNQKWTKYSLKYQTKQNSQQQSYLIEFMFNITMNISRENKKMQQYVDQQKRNHYQQQQQHQQLYQQQQNQQTQQIQNPLSLLLLSGFGNK